MSNKWLGNSIHRSNLKHKMSRKKKLTESCVTFFEVKQKSNFSEVNHNSNSKDIKEEKDMSYF